MSWSFSAIKYGWTIPATITLAAITIFVASNTRHRVNQADIIEIALGTTERCLATQYQTNPAAYRVAPPAFIRSWYSNSYDTQVVAGVTSVVAVLHTNIVTNTIGWRTDRAMLVELDATIKALVPYYCDTNCNTLTVTGLWATLQIGDRTNQFTRTPAWVNTNGVTNVATYGDYPWQIYVEDLQERYKVLNALKATVRVDPDIKEQFGKWTSYGVARYYSEAEAKATANAEYIAQSPDGLHWSNLPPEKWWQTPPSSWTMIVNDDNSPYEWDAEVGSSYIIYHANCSTQIEHAVDVWMKAVPFIAYIWGEYNPCHWGNQGQTEFTEGFAKVQSVAPSFSGYQTFQLGDSLFVLPSDWSSENGFMGFQREGPTWLKYTWSFSYCTNKFW